MKALIICSLHALCDFSQQEREACNRACALHDIPFKLSAHDHAEMLANASMLQIISHLPGALSKRHALIDSYVEILNAEIWEASLNAHQSVLSTLLDKKCFTRPTGFVSDYPMLTTNLARSSVLGTNATKLGHLTPQTCPLKIHGSKTGLTSCASMLGIAHDEIEVLVAHERDFLAAQALGMKPRFVEELLRLAQFRQRRGQSSTKRRTLPIANSVSIPQTSAISV